MIPDCQVIVLLEFRYGDIFFCCSHFSGNLNILENNLETNEKVKKKTNKRNPMRIQIEAIKLKH
jgi:hypothetical protein